MVASVTAVLLAAGSSSRFTGDLPKQLLPLEGEPLVRRAARCALASAAGQVVVVVGHAAGKVQRALGDLDVEIVTNPGWSAGQSSSVRVGLQSVDETAGAALFMPIDQPLLTPSVLDRLIDFYRETGARIIVPTAEGKRGSPVLFDRSLFPELSALQGDAGGRQLFPRYAEAVVELELINPEVLIDIDEPNEYHDLLERMRAR